MSVPIQPWSHPPRPTMKWARPGLWTHRSTLPVVRLLARLLSLATSCYYREEQKVFIEFFLKISSYSARTEAYSKEWWTVEMLQLCFRDNVFLLLSYKFGKKCRFLIPHHAPIVSTFRHTDTTHEIVTLLLEITPKRLKYDRLYNWAVFPRPNPFFETRPHLDWTGLRLAM